MRDESYMLRRGGRQAELLTRAVPDDNEMQMAFQAVSSLLALDVETGMDALAVLTAMGKLANRGRDYQPLLWRSAVKALAPAADLKFDNAARLLTLIGKEIGVSPYHLSNVSGQDGDTTLNLFAESDGRTGFVLRKPDSAATVVTAAFKGNEAELQDASGLGPVQRDYCRDLFRRAAACADRPAVALEDAIRSRAMACQPNTGSLRAG